MALTCVVLGDIHGLPPDDACFLQEVGGPVSIHRADLGDLLGIETSGEALHLLLAEHGGFDAAATRVRDLFGSADIGLGYSAGGTVLWKSVLLGLELRWLICISSTRLRNEDPDKMRIPALTVFGGLDAHRPPASWGAGSDVRKILLNQADHAFYRSRDAAWSECHRAVLDFIGTAGSPV